MTKKTKAKGIVIPDGRSVGYKKWIKTGTNIIRSKLPFKGTADVGVTVGSGLRSLVEFLRLKDVRVIPYDSVGLPVGQNRAHKKELIVGITAEGKKVVIVNGRTHAYEIPNEGIETKIYGRLDPMELATGYLAMLNEIGVANFIVTCAAGGINHPATEKIPDPFDEKSLPQIGCIAADLNEAYPSFHMGHYKGEKGDFFNLKDADRGLMTLFKQAMVDAGDRSDVPSLYYMTSPSTPSFEDVASVYDVAVRGGQVVGMSYSYEKQFISGVNGIRRFMGVAVVTNSIELIYRNQKNMNKNAIPVEKLRLHYPWEFIIAHHASDKEVQRVGKLANERLGNALSCMVKSL